MGLIDYLDSRDPLPVPTVGHANAEVERLDREGERRLALLRILTWARDHFDEIDTAFDALWPDPPAASVDVIDQWNEAAATFDLSREIDTVRDEAIRLFVDHAKARERRDAAVELRDALADVV